MLKKEDGLIDWGKGPRALKNLVRGMTPWPGAFTFLDGKQVKIFRVRAAEGTGAPGEVLRADRTGLEVACAGGSLFIDELQLEGRKRLSAGEFLAGMSITPGTAMGKEPATP
jgi:methionyl-tRNA formyltransferase